jgi:MYXO-CTERM domain-containing protein
MADGFSDAPGDTVLMVQSLQVKPAAAPADAQLGVHASDYAGNDTVALLPAAMGGTVNMGGSPAMSSGGCNVSGTASPSGAWLLLALIMFAARRRFN